MNDPHRQDEAATDAVAPISADPHVRPTDAQAGGQQPESAPERQAGPAPDREAGPASEPEPEPASGSEAGPAPATGSAEEVDDAAREPALDLEAMAEADPRSRTELYGALLAAETQRDEYLDDLRRARAEFENYRRRIMREGATQRDAGKAEAFSSLFEALDDLERTVEASEGSDDPSLAKGLQLVASKLVAALGAQGLTRIDAVDAPFDPNEHEAVQQAPGDGSSDEPVVTQVLRPGYRLGDRVLRPAMVVVSS